jgi:quinol monooxygenase YgiN
MQEVAMVQVLRAILLQLAQASRREDGVLRYELFETKAPGEFLFQEEYASEAAFQSHKASPHVRMAVRHAIPTDGRRSDPLGGPSALSSVVGP